MSGAAVPPILSLAFVEYWNYIDRITFTRTKALTARTAAMMLA